MVIVPARLESLRFPKKVLEPIGGIPMVVRVAKSALEVDDTVVATESEEVVSLCKREGICAILTSPSCASGTDRVYEASNLLELGEDEIVINLQGDEPFMESSVIKRLKDRAIKARDDKEGVLISSCYKIIESEDPSNPNIVKVILDSNSYAIYFSRSVIPYNRDGSTLKYFAHLGIYAFTKRTLKEFCSLPHSYLEHHEKLEQLRAISARKKIAMVEVESKSFGIDTKEDFLKAEELLRANF